jgi:hypothetical protein
VSAEPTVAGGLEASSLVELAVRRLRSEILSGTLAPGERLVEEQLTRRFGTPDHDIDAGNPLIIDVDATLVTAHSEKEGAAPTFKLGFGHHPLWAFCEHGPAGSGEPLSHLLRPGNAGSKTAGVWHRTVVREPSNLLHLTPGQSQHRPA